MEDYIRAVQHSVGEGARRAGRFASLIPGFPDLDPSDRAILVRGMSGLPCSGIDGGRYTVLHTTPHKVHVLQIDGSSST